jgi:N-acetylglucosamine-6-phosphate deacetylase
MRLGHLTFDHVVRALVVSDADDPQAPILSPGFVDLHVHGGGGGDTMDGEGGVRSLARTHLRFGTTALLATTLTAPWAEVRAALAGVLAVMERPLPGEAALLGAHLEGPFISPERLGAQPPHARAASEAQVEELLRFRVIRVATVAPEISGLDATLPAWARAGVRLHVGHTRADADRVEAFLARYRALGGEAGATHLFNAMGGLAGREPGALGALLADPDARLELICDGHHVSATAIRLAWRVGRERLLLITDAIAAAGLGDGASSLGGQPVAVRGGAARLADGTLAGSVLTMDAAVRGAVAAGVPLADALHAATRAPALHLGLTDRGVLAVGARADIVRLTPDLQVDGVWLAGSRLGSRPD